MNNVDNLIEGLGGTVSPEAAAYIQPAPADLPPPLAAGFGGGGFGFGGPGVEAPLTAKEEKAVLAASAPSSARGTAMPSANKRFGVLAKLVPGGNRVRIKLRRDNGQLGTISDYVIRDIQQDGDVESFITRRLKPRFGGGEYSVFILDDSSVEHFSGTVDLIPDPGAAVGGAQDNALLGLLAQGQHDLKQALSRPQPDPMEQFERTKKIMDTLEGGGGKNDVLIAMMGMQQRAQESAAQSQRELMTAMFAQRSAGPDPALAAVTALLDRMDRRLEKLEQAPPMGPPMAAPAGPSTIEIIQAIGGVVAMTAPLLSSFRTEPMKPETLIGLITGAQQAAAQAAGADKVTTRELLEIVRGEKERERPAVTLEDEINRALKMREFASSFAPQASGPAGTSFWDALVALFSSNDFAAAIGGRIRESGNKPQTQQQQTQQPQQADVIDITRARQQRQGPQQMGAEAQQIIAFPDNFDVLCKAIDEGVDDGARVEATVRALFALYPQEQWKPFITDLLRLAGEGEKEKVLRGLGGWFKLLVEKTKLLTRASAIATLKAFDDHWEMIRADLLARMPHLAVGAPQQAPQAPQGQQAPQAQQAQRSDGPSDVPADMEAQAYEPDVVA